MMRLKLALLHVCASLVLVLAATGCESEDEPLLDGVAASEEALSYYSDTAADPLPTTQDLVQPNGVVIIYPGARACYPALPANNSAGIGGQIGGNGISKLPKLMVFWARDFRSPVSKIFAAPIQPEASGFFLRVLNRTNGFASFFPGVFQFCIRNPAVNTGPILTNATVTTF